MDHDVVRRVCGWTWTTRVKGVLLLHRCERPIDHSTMWHGCTGSGPDDPPHTIERVARRPAESIA